MMVQKARRLDFGFISPDMKLAGLKLNKFLDLGEGFTGLLEICCNNPMSLIGLLLEVYMIYYMAKKYGGVHGLNSTEAKLSWPLLT